MYFGSTVELSGVRSRWVDFLVCFFTDVVPDVSKGALYLLLYRAGRVLIELSEFLGL